MTRRAPQNGFQQTDSFLGQPITGKEINIGQRLSDELLCFVIELSIGGISRRLSLDFGRLYFRRQFGSSLLYQFDWRGCLIFVFVMRCYRSLFLNGVAQFAKNCVQLALGSIAFRLSSDKLLIDFFRALKLLGTGKSVAEMGEGIGQAEGITCASV